MPTSVLCFGVEATSILWVVYGHCAVTLRACEMVSYEISRDAAVLRSSARDLQAVFDAGHSVSDV